MNGNALESIGCFATVNYDHMLMLGKMLDQVIHKHFLSSLSTGKKCSRQMKNSHVRPVRLNGRRPLGNIALTNAKHSTATVRLRRKDRGSPFMGKGWRKVGLRLRTDLEGGGSMQLCAGG